jgi:hypothetical protein
VYVCFGEREGETIIYVCFRESIVYVCFRERETLLCMYVSERVLCMYVSERDSENLLCMYVYIYIYIASQMIDIEHPSLIIEDCICICA